MSTTSASAPTTSTTSRSVSSPATTRQPIATPTPPTGHDDLRFQTLSIPDGLTLFSYIILIMLISFIASFRVSYGVRAFFLANRSYGFITIACSMFMSNIGSASFVGLAGAASKTGLSVYAYELNSVFALLILGWFFMPVYIASGSLTTIDYLKKRYGGKRIEIYLAFLSLFIIIFSIVAVELCSIYRVMESVFKGVPWWTLCTPPLLWCIYTCCSGGLQSVVTNNVIHTLLLIITAIFIARYSMQTFEKFDDLRDQYFDAWPNTSKIHFGEPAEQYKYTTCGQPKSRSWNLFRSYFNLELPWPGMVFGIMITSLWYFCCDQLIVQSCLGARSLLQVKYACIICAYGKILTILFMVLPGIVARIRYPDIVACADPTICDKACGRKFGCPDTAFPMLFIDVIPKNYRGLVLSGLITCCVTSVSSALNSGSTLFTINIYRNLRPVATEMEMIVVSRISALCLGAISLALVPIVMKVQVIHTFSQAFMSFLTPPIVAVFLCAMFWERASEEAAFSSLLLGLILAVIRVAWRAWYPMEVCGETLDSPVPQIISNFHSLHFAIFLFTLCAVYIAMAGVFAEPINVVHLYRLTYWLRHSKLDRVDLNELQEVYERLRAERGAMEAMAAFGGSPLKKHSIGSGSGQARRKTGAGVDDTGDQFWDDDQGFQSTFGQTEPTEDEPKRPKRSLKAILSRFIEEVLNSCCPSPTLDADVEAAEQKQVEEGKPLEGCAETTRLLCCIKPQQAHNPVTNSELRETAKQRADIKETQQEESVVNMLALVLLLVTAVLWGFLA